MESFSQRMGLEPAEKPIQLNDLDSRSRNKLWNILHIHLWSLWSESDWEETVQQYQNRQSTLALVDYIWHEFYGLSTDDMPSFSVSHNSVTYGDIRKAILNGPWNKAFDLLQFITININSYFDSKYKLPEKLCQGFNAVLRQENVGFRFINKIVAPISNELEIECIEDTLTVPLDSVRKHFKTALVHISNRDNPDYRNSVKESISAVEAICQVISGKQKASLGECLNIIKAKHALHGAFEKSLRSLYGYTSDGEGIRHSLNDKATGITADDAKFMLVTCSAFVNYLVSLAATDGVELKSPTT